MEKRRRVYCGCTTIFGGLCNCGGLSPSASCRMVERPRTGNLAVPLAARVKEEKVDFLHEPTSRDLANCSAPADYQNLQKLVQEARQIGAVVTIQEFPPHETMGRCYGLCRTCPHTDDCSIPYENILGGQDSIPGAAIA